MINLLMRQPPIILQQVILLRPRRLDKLLRNRLYHPSPNINISPFAPEIPSRSMLERMREEGAYQNLGQGLVGDVGQLRAVVFGDYELGWVSGIWGPEMTTVVGWEWRRERAGGRGRTAWP